MKTPPGGWPLTIQVGIAVAVTIALSIWQVSRGFEKLDEKQAFELQLSQAPVSEEDWRLADFAHQKVTLRGQFDPRRWFIIENRRYLGRTGYWIVQVFDTQQDRYLVNRGWIPVHGSVQIDPDIETPKESLTITGIGWPNPVHRASSSLSPPDWPMRMRDIEIGHMARMTSARAIEIRLLEGSPGVTVPAPLQREFSTAIHWGYAAQWLLIGSLVIGGYWFFTVRKEKQKETS